MAVGALPCPIVNLSVAMAMCHGREASRAGRHMPIDNRGSAMKTRGR